jgi:hypothetical protein
VTPFQLPDFESLAAAAGQPLVLLATQLCFDDEQLDLLVKVLDVLPDLAAAAAAAADEGQLSRLQRFRACYARLRAQAGCPDSSAERVKEAFMLLLQHAAPV